ncbi:MAG: hypothetical protein FH756_11555 [Firmicutes bacterium]|nr:hypothetical protein [Bacillota bacterium]
MTWKRIIFICTILAMTIPPQYAFAGTNIKVNPGLNGIYQTDRPVKINITIVNSETALENALLEVYVAKQGDYVRRPQHEAIYKRAVSVAAGETLETSIVIPGSMARSEPRVRLLSNNKEIAGQKVQGIAINSEMIGISVGEAPLSNGLQAWLGEHMNDITVKYMPAGEVPADPLALETADIIILDKNKISELTASQVDAVKKWVKLGGDIVLSGGAGASEGEPFADISPVLVTGEKNITGSINGLRNDTGAVQIAVGKFARGEERLAANNTLLVADRNLGRGNVIFSAIGLDSLAAADGKIWEGIFAGIDRANEKMVFESNSLVQASATIPQLKMPSVLLLAGIWALYMVIIGPGLYLILKRYNRREWAWLCIPGLAVVTASLLYFFAPFHRLGGPLGQTLAMVKIMDENVAEVQAGSSFVLPRGGTLSLTAPGEAVITPQRRYSNSGDLEDLPVIKFIESEQTVHFEQVEFWSMRQAATYKIDNNFGEIEGSLKISGDRISGSLQNKTGMNLTKCMVVVGEKAFDIGALPRGKEVQVEYNLSKAKFFDWQNEPGKWFFPGQDIPAIEHVAVSTIRPTTWREKEGNYFDEGIQLIGYGNNVPGLAQIKNEGARNYSSAMIMQRLPLDLTGSGKFTLPAGLIPARVIGNSGSVQPTPEGKLIHGQNVKLEYNLRLPGQHRNAEIKSVEFQYMSGDEPYRLEIFNWTKGKWEEMTLNKTRMEAEELKPYISEAYRIRIFIRGLGAKNIVPVPSVAVEGVAIND